MGYEESPFEGAGFGNDSWWSDLFEGSKSSAFGPRRPNKRNGKPEKDHPLLGFMRQGLSWMS